MLQIKPHLFRCRHHHHYHRRRLPLLLCLLALPTFPAWAGTLDPAETLKVIFHESAEVIPEKKTLTEEAQKTLSRRVGSEVAKSDWTFYIAKTGKRIDGYALIDHEIGKTEPISFLTAIDPSGRVLAVEILAYRESIGGEVQGAAFLKQYRGKTVFDPVRVGQDIANISGATLSCRGVSLGVRRDLALWNYFYGKRN